MIRQKSAGKGVVRADEFEAQDDLMPSTNGNGDRRVLPRQELHYFVPCVVGGKMVAVIGLGRTSDGSRSRTAVCTVNKNATPKSSLCSRNSTSPLSNR
jgi:hypothetical protein